ncbi:MAG: hypothetical protein RL748_4489 [Pseudomonadota bacterium]|jgi:hypothetical protein
MAGHPLLNQVRSKSEPITVNGKTFNIVLSYNRVIGIDGYVVGLKFTDAIGSMDSSQAKAIHGMVLGNAIAHRAVQMLKPDLDCIAILGFYLLTDDLDLRRPGGRSTKIWLYDQQATTIHRNLKDKLQHLTNFEVQGGTAWAMSAKPYGAYDQFKLLENELAKQIRITPC